MSSELQLVVFSLNLNNQEAEYGIAIEQVQEIIRMVPITSLPQTPDYIEGIVNLRNELVPILNIKKRFLELSHDFDERTRIMILDVEGHKFGIIVDEVQEVIHVSEEDVEEPPAIISKIAEEYIQNVVKVGERLIILLRLEKLWTLNRAELVKS